MKNSASDAGLRMRRAVVETLESRQFLSTVLQPGAVDPRYGVAGRAQVGLEGWGMAQSSAALTLPDGKILVAGQAGPSLGAVFGGFEDVFAGVSPDFLLARYNADGSLDKTFGAGGIVTTDIQRGSYDQANDLALQTVNGRTRIVVGGTIRVQTYDINDCVLAAYTLDGKLDPTFGLGGKVITHFVQSAGSSFDDGIRSLVIDRSGRIVAAAGAGSGKALGLARWDANGKYDPKFGTAPTPAFNFTASELALSPDGKLVAAGSISYPYTGQTEAYDAGDYGVARLTADGAADVTFNKGKPLAIDFSGGYDLAESLAVQADGRIIVGGTTRTLDEGYFRGRVGLARLRTDGTRDASFGVNGLVKTTVGQRMQGSALAIQRDGKIVTAGDTFAGGATSDPDHFNGFAFVRYLPDGTLDPSFGSDASGVRIADFDNEARVSDLLVTAAGQIVEVGSIPGPYLYTNDVPKIQLMRVTPNGSFDPSFGRLDAPADILRPPGVSLTAPRTGLIDQAADSFALPDGKLLIVGYSTYLPHTFSGGFLQLNDTLVVTRLLPDGKPDPTFGVGGTARVALPGADLYSFAFPQAVTVQSDGKLVIAIQANMDNVGVVRLLANGKVDTKFGTSGPGFTVLVSETGLSRRERISDIVVRDNGKIVVVGTRAYNDFETFRRDSEFCLTQFNANGSLDTKFGTAGNGQVLTDFGRRQDDFAKAALLQPDGRLLVFGNVNGFDYWGDFGDDFGVARYNVDGTLDTGFGGGDGVITLRFQTFTEAVSHTAHALAIRADGGFVLGGTIEGYNADSTGGQYGTLAAFGTDGSVDTSFGGLNGDAPGTVVLDQALADVRALVSQPDGRIAAAGHAPFLYMFEEGIAVTRLNADGSPDERFGVGGTSVTRADRTDRGRDLLTFANGLVVDMHLTPAGDLLVVGSTALPDRDADFHVLKLVGAPTTVDRPIVTRFSIVNAKTGAFLRDLKDYDTINLAEFNVPIAIRAELDPATVGTAGVRFEIAGVSVLADRAAPYVVFPLTTLKNGTTTGGLSTALLPGRHQLGATGLRPGDADNAIGLMTLVNFFLADRPEWLKW